jgi:integral membrane sensor domain MASE1
MTEPASLRHLQRQAWPAVTVLAVLGTVFLLTPFPWQHQTCHTTTTTTTNQR